jgi:hypothetical protein
MTCVTQRLVAAVWGEKHFQVGPKAPFKEMSPTSLRPYASKRNKKYYQPSIRITTRYHSQIVLRILVCMIPSTQGCPCETWREKMVIERYLRAHLYVPVDAPYVPDPAVAAKRRTCACGRSWDEVVPVRQTDGKRPRGSWRLERPGAITAAELTRWSKGTQSECTGDCKLPILAAPSLRQP